MHWDWRTEKLALGDRAWQKAQSGRALYVVWCVCVGWGVSSPARKKRVAAKDIAAFELPESGRLRPRGEGALEGEVNDGQEVR